MFTQEESRKGGIARAKQRWEDKTPETVRGRSVHIKISEEEHEMLSNKAKKYGMSKTNLIVMAVEKFSH